MSASTTDTGRAGTDDEADGDADGQPIVRPGGLSERPVKVALRWVRTGWRAPAVCYLAVATAVMTVVWYSASRLELNPRYPGPWPRPFTGDALVGGWMRWDANWYVFIAAHGYWYRPGVASPVAFFPAYPLAMRAVNLLVRDPTFILAGVIVTVLAALGATVAFHHWGRLVLDRVPAGAAGRREPARVAIVAVVTLLVFPYAWYLYGAVYADALFLVTVIVAFVALERDRPVLAGVVAVVATAGRPVGAGVMLGLVAVMLERRRVVVIPFLDEVRTRGWRATWRDAVTAGPRRWRRSARAVGGAVTSVQVRLSNLRVRDGGVLIGAAGLIGWMLYLGRTFGDPLAFVNVQGAPGWSQPPGPWTWFKFSWLASLRRVPTFVGDVDQFSSQLLLTVGWTFQAALVIGALCLVPAVVRRIGWGYALYVIGVVGIPMIGSKDWHGTGRYLLAAFPVFLVAGGWLSERPWTRRVVLSASAVLLLAGASGFARGYYLA
jgi:hypothetical protein